MSISVRCPGCARSVALTDDDPRVQIRCPACGLSFERPAARSDAITAEPPPSPRAIRAGQPGSRAGVVTCEQCGERLRAAGSRDHEPLRCPVCGALVARPSRQIAAKLPPVKATTASSQITAVPGQPTRPSRADDDGDEQYHFATEPRRCPRCDRELDGSAVLCLACGFNSETGEQVVREFTEIDRIWDGGLSRRRRLGTFGIVQAVCLPMLIGAILGDVALEAVIVWLIGTVLLAYTLGTFCRLQVARSRTGNVKMVRTWHIGLIPLRPTRVNLRQYGGVATGMEHGADLWDWIVLLTCVGYGIVPGLIWWYLAFHCATFYVGLTRDHGMRALDLYRGWNEGVMRDIAQVVRDVGGYPA
jgi:predicted amidophosphoribosyltransferase